MIRNSLVAGGVAVVIAAAWGLREFEFLKPYKAVIIADYSGYVAAFFGLLFVDVSAGWYVVARGMGMKTTGRKLAHIDRSGAIGELKERQDNE